MRDLRGYWAKHPPVHLLVGGLLGKGGGKPNRVVGVSKGSGAVQPIPGRMSAEDLAEVKQRFKLVS